MIVRILAEAWWVSVVAVVATAAALGFIFNYTNPELTEMQCLMRIVDWDWRSAVVFVVPAWAVDLVVRVLMIEAGEEGSRDR